MNKLVCFFFLLFVFFKKVIVVQCVIEKQNAYLDDDFKSFTYFFASSPSADFLSRIVHTHDPRFVQLKIGTGVMSKTVDKAFAINQVSNEIMRGFISVLLFALLPFYLYIGVYGHTQNRLTATLASVWAYFSMLIVFFLTNGLLNIGFVCALPLVAAVYVFYLANSNCSTKSLYLYTRYIFCFICSKLFYDVLTNLSKNVTNHFDYGPSGFIYMTLLKGNNYFLLKLLHLSVLSLLAFIIIKTFPQLFSPNALQSPQSVKADKCITSLLCALPIAASLSQFFFLVTTPLNPIDPSVFFMIPSSINFVSPNTIIPLTAWVVITYALIILSKLVEKDYNHALNKIPTKVSRLLQFYF